MVRSLLALCMVLAVAALALAVGPLRWLADEAASQAVTLQPDPSPEVIPYYRDWTKGEEPKFSRQEKIALLRAKVKYVFVIFNENQSFDHYFGTFPGANGIYSDGKQPRAARDTPGFTQTYANLATGATATVEPFRIGPVENANVYDSADHSHIGLARKLHVSGNAAAMDQFALDEYRRFVASAGDENEKKGTQFARLVMSHVDCDTIPFLWQYASRFILFDNMFATQDAPSTPNAIALIAGQSGETQWVKHGKKAGTLTAGGHSGTAQGPPIVNDPEPLFGSQFDAAETGRQPRGTRERYEDSNIAANLTFASLPLTFLGRDAAAATSQDLDPENDLADIRQDIEFVARHGGKPVAWRWYEGGLRSRTGGRRGRRLARQLREPSRGAAIFRLHRQ